MVTRFVKINCIPHQNIHRSSLIWQYSLTMLIKRLRIWQESEVVIEICAGAWRFWSVSFFSAQICGNGIVFHWRVVHIQVALRWTWRRIVVQWRYWWRSWCKIWFKFFLWAADWRLWTSVLIIFHETIVSSHDCNVEKNEKRNENKCYFFDIIVNKTFLFHKKINFNFDWYLWGSFFVVRKKVFQVRYISPKTE